MKKILLYALLPLTIIFFAGCANNEPPVDVKTEKISALDESAIISHDGKISLSDEQTILPKISGKVIATYCAGGQDITENQPLFKIGTHEKENELLQAKAELGENMTALAQEISELNQAEQLLKKNSATAQEVAEKNFKVQERQAKLAEQQALVKKLEEETAAGIVLSPITGQIDVDSVKTGATVTENETVLAHVGKINPAAVKFEISPEEKNFLTASTPKVLLKLSDGTIYQHEGKINFVETLTAAAIFDNPEKILPLGKAVRVEITGLKMPGALLVPEKSIQLRGEENYVFVVDSNKKAALKKISLGGKIGTYYIVKDGLRAGDSVVVEGLTNLRDGTPVKLGSD